MGDADVTATISMVLDDGSTEDLLESARDAALVFAARARHYGDVASALLKAFDIDPDELDTVTGNGAGRALPPIDGLEKVAPADGRRKVTIDLDPIAPAIDRSAKATPPPATEGPKKRKGRGAAIPDELRAEVADYAREYGIAATKKKYGLAQSTVSRYKREFPAT